MKTFNYLLLSLLFVQPVIGQHLEQNSIEHSRTELFKDPLKSYSLCLQLNKTAKELRGKEVNHQEKTTPVLTHRLDSTITEDVFFNYKSMYTYDENGRCEYEIQYFLEDDEYFPLYRIQYTYDENDNIILKEQTHWNVFSEMWTPEYMIEYDFDENGLISSVSYFYYDDDFLTWIIENTESYFFDENSRLINFNSPFIEISFNYNEEGLLISSEEGVAGTMYPDQLNWNYNVEQKLSSISRTSWNEDLSEYEEQVLIDLYYDIMGNLVEQTLSLFDSEGVGEVATTYSQNRDLDGNIINSQGAQYDEFGSLTSGQRTEREYDNDVDASSLLIPSHLRNVNYPFDFNFGNELITVNEYLIFTKKQDVYSKFGYSDGNWMVNRVFTLFYTDLTVTAVSESSGIQLHAFPNPVESSLTISCTGESGLAFLKITDLNGRLVRSESALVNSTIDLSDLKAGLYIANVKYKDVNFSYKLVKQ